MKKWEKCKSCAIDNYCENQDKNIECKSRYKFISGRKFIEDISFYKKLKGVNKCIKYQKSKVSQKVK